MDDYRETLDPADPNFVTRDYREAKRFANDAADPDEPWVVIERRDLGNVDFVAAPAADAEGYTWDRDADIVHTTDGTD